MKRIFNNVDINFRVQKNQTNDNFVLLLHGWGGNLNSFRGIESYLLSRNFSIINVDFPGFGNSQLPPNSYCLDDYVKIITEMLEFLHLKKVSVIAHSFGGRVAIKLASKTTFVDKMILVDSAGIKPKFNITTTLKQTHFKILKFLVNKKIIRKDLSNFGSQDYKAVPNDLKPVFVRIINEDLSPLLAKIECPTLLIWGQNDKSTPLYMAKKIKKNIKDGELLVFKNSGHFSYLENHDQFCLIVDSFLS